MLINNEDLQLEIYKENGIIEKREEEEDKDESFQLATKAYRSAELDVRINNGSFVGKKIIITCYFMKGLFTIIFFFAKKFKKIFYVATTN